MPKLFRGLSLSSEKEAASVIESVRYNGLLSTDRGIYKAEIPSPSAIAARSSEMLGHLASVRSHINAEPKEPAIYACGDAYGAHHYATVHNRSAKAPVGVVIQFQAPLDHMIVDGRDFLYTVFQLWDRKKSHGVDKQREILSALFGPKVRSYFDMAVATQDHMERLGACDLACNDSELIEGHLLNRIAIHGRYKTRFCSAFAVTLPIQAESIIEVRHACEVAFEAPDGYISLEDVV